MTDQPIHLANDDVSIALSPWGCAVMDWQVGGNRMVLGYEDPKAYRDNAVAMGAICGRVANRIRAARFELSGETWVLPPNEGETHLHGGPNGFSRRLWTVVRADQTTAVFTLSSPHLDDGYPGALDAQVEIRLEGHRLTWNMQAHVDRPTPVNFAQHVYFNLGLTDIRDAVLRIDANHYTPVGPDLVPDGSLAPVSGALDFRAPVKIGHDYAPGHDLNYVLSDEADVKAEVSGGGHLLRLWTDQPALQVYTSNSLKEIARPWPGQTHQAYAAICLEGQGFPNAVNEPSFPSIIATPDAPFRQTTAIEIVPSPAQK